MTSLLFVYGTLKNGHSRFKNLSKQRYIGIAKTSPEYSMYQVQTYPALVKCNNGRKIYGELYEVDSECLKVLDNIEGVDFNLFKREEIILEEISIINLPLSQICFSNLYQKKAEAYLYQRPIDELKNMGIFWPLT